MKYLFCGIIFFVVVLYGSVIVWSRTEGFMNNTRENSTNKNITIMYDSAFNKDACANIAHFLKDLIKDKNVQSTIIDVASYNLPFLYESTPPKVGKKSSDPRIKKWSSVIEQSEAFIWIAAEHNGAYVGTFKNALDLLYPEWNDKLVGLVVYCNESTQGKWLSERFPTITEELRMRPILPVVLINNAVQSSPPLLDNALKAQLETMVDHIITARPAPLVTRIKNAVIRHVEKIGFKLLQSFGAITHIFNKKCSTAKTDQQVIVVPAGFTIKIITGSTRDGRLSLTIASYIQNIMQHIFKVNADILDIKNFNLIPVHDTNTNNRDVLEQSNDAQLWSAAIQDADAFIIVVPEYNNGLPGVLKNALDTLSTQWHNKPVAFVSYSGGPDGGKGAVKDLAYIVNALEMKKVMPSIYIPFSWKAVDNKGRVVEAGFQETLYTMVKNLIVS